MVSVLCQMFVCVRMCVCVCVLSCYLSPVVENGICFMSNVCVRTYRLYVVLLSQPSSREWYLLYVKCVCLRTVAQ